MGVRVFEICTEPENSGTFTSSSCIYARSELSSGLMVAEDSLIGVHGTLGGTHSANFMGNGASDRKIYRMDWDGDLPL